MGSSLLEEGGSFFFSGVAADRFPHALGDGLTTRYIWADLVCY